MNKNIMADIVVVGAGGAGLAAAVTAAEQGAKNIVVLEARGVPGGNSMFAEGLFAMDSQSMKPADIHATKDRLFKRTMAFTHQKINPSLISTLIAESEKTLVWLTQRGFNFEWVSNIHDGEIPLYASDTKAKRKTGAAIIKAMVEECQDKGIKILGKTRARKLLTDDSGKVTGLLADASGEQLKISSGCVIIASGGFAGNKKLLRKYFPTFTDSIDRCGVPNRGDGILMAAAAGADTDDTVAPEMEGPAFSWTRQLPTAFLGHRYTVWINNRGERFTEEMFDPFQCANIINRQPDKVSYTLLDEAIKHRITQEETLPGLAGEAELDKMLRAHAGKGRIKIADSWDEIAEWTGISSETLKATIKEYNTYCQNGHDASYFKNPANLLPLRQPPFYAIHCCPSLLVTHGGIRISLQMEVLGKPGGVIKGLYAAGVDTGGVDSDTYNFSLPGHSFGFALSTGRIAGRQAAEYVSGK